MRPLHVMAQLLRLLLAFTDQGNRGLLGKRWSYSAFTLREQSNRVMIASARYGK